jgi:hypothetical protein
MLATVPWHQVPHATRHRLAAAAPCLWWRRGQLVAPGPHHLIPPPPPPPIKGHDPARKNPFFSFLRPKVEQLHHLHFHT